MNFDFAAKGEPLSYCVTMAKNMQDCDEAERMSYLIRSRYGPIQFDKEKVDMLGKLLADPTNTLTFV